MKLRSNRTLLALMIAALTTLAGCTPAAQTGSQLPVTPPAAAAANQQHTTAAAAPEPYRAEGKRTFLDTLNRGQELAIAADDLPALVVVTRDTPAPTAATQSGEPRFRIQILASSQADMVRREKINAQTALGQPIFMASEQSLFKLYVGDFGTRAEAEAALPGVRSKGYADAWVVTTRD